MASAALRGQGKDAVALKTVTASEAARIFSSSRICFVSWQSVYNLLRLKLKHRSRSDHPREDEKQNDQHRRRNSDHNPQEHRKDTDEPAEGRDRELAYRRIKRTCCAFTASSVASNSRVKLS